MATKLQVVGVLVPNEHQRQMIKDAQEWDIAARVAARCKFFDYHNMKRRAEAAFFEDELATAMCKMIYHPHQRRYAAKSLRARI
jgi:hypothetical protein